MMKTLLYFACAFTILVISALLGNIYLFFNQHTQEYPRDAAYSYIAHAGGGIDNLTYTNSLEAVNLSLSKGFRAIELDLIKSSDGMLIAAHDWKHFKEIIGFKDVLDTPMHSSAIKGVKIHEKYTILTGKDIRKLLSDNPDLILFTDKSNDFSLIRDLGFDSRVYVEVFGVFNFYHAIYEGIVNPILNVDIGRLGPLPRMLYVLVTNPNFVAMSTRAVNEHPKYVNWLFNRGIKIFIYTSNDSYFINEMIKNYDATIYTDFYKP